MPVSEDHVDDLEDVTVQTKVSMANNIYPCGMIIQEGVAGRNENMFGYAGKILRIDLSNGKIEKQKLPVKLAREYIGGRGLATKLLYDEVRSNANPLSADNRLIFTTGPFTGTIVPSSSRYSVTAKSPLTCLWASSDCGGTWGQELKFSGFDGIVLSGIAKKPVYVWINEGNVEIKSADHIWGKFTYETDEIIRQETNSKAVVACIGPAGERLVKFAAIVSNGKHARVAGRAGLGAVMGFKKLKAISVRGTSPIEIAKTDRLQKAVNEVLPIITKNTAGLAKNGTANIVESAEVAGDLPIKNWRQGLWDKAEKISGSTMTKSILVGRYYCGRCIIGCGRLIKISDGKYAGTDGAGPEYETLAALGSLCLVDDLQAIAKANDLCNRYGLDTISAGSAVAFAIEAFEKKLLTKKETCGLDLAWGDAETVVRLITMIGERRGVGKILGEGVRNAARKIGRNAEEFAIQVKGLELPMHDPRCYVSLALGYATANRGACHLEALSHLIEKGTEMPELGYDRSLDPYSIEKKAEMVAKMQNLMSVFDSLPTCKFLLFGKVRVQNLVDWLGAITGWRFTMKRLLRIGERIFNLERLYNVNCGVSRKDDTLPPRILVNERKDRGEATNLPHLGKMLNEYYEYRGWSNDGIPTQEKLKELRLPLDLPPYLVRHKND